MLDASTHDVTIQACLFAHDALEVARYQRRTGMFTFSAERISFALEKMSHVMEYHLPDHNETVMLRTKSIDTMAATAFQDLVIVPGKV